MAITINHETNDISATGSDTVTIDGADVGAAITNGTSTEGYVTLGGSLIIMWGTTSSVDMDEDLDHSITFGTAFPNACHNVQLTQLANADHTYDAFEVFVRTKSTTGFTFRVGAANSNSHGNYQVMWTAIGY